MSKLIVEVCKVEKIEKHPNADRLSIVTIKGWNCIVSLDQFKVGDLVVYCPVDCIIPADLIEKYNLEYLKKDGRVKTVKLRKYISQGLILDVPKGYEKEGKDVAKVLGITKYEVPEPKYQRNSNKPTWRKKNPDFDKYTDINNIKNYNKIFKGGDLVVITEKIHGSNFRAGKLPIAPGSSIIDKIKYLIKKYIRKEKYEFVYGSHNVQLTSNNKNKNFYGEDVYGRMAKKYNLAEIIPEDYIVYGEIYGKGIQDLTYGLEEIDLAIFDIKHKGKYLNWSEVVEFCLYNHLPVVPILNIEPFLKDTVSHHTEGQSTIAPNQVREGCVIKPVVEENNPRIGRKILKSINPKYLLRKGATEYK